MILYKKNIIKVAVFFIASFFFIFPAILFAGSGTACDPASQICNPIKFKDIPELFEAILGIAAQIGSVFVVLGLIYSGFLFVMARGNEEELSKAKRAITYTVIGAAIVLGAWAFSVAIRNTVNTIVTPTAEKPPGLGGADKLT